MGRPLASVIQTRLDLKSSRHGTVIRTKLGSLASGAIRP
jgi:hypothetical protein